MAGNRTTPVPAPAQDGLLAKAGHAVADLVSGDKKDAQAAERVLAQPGVTQPQDVAKLGLDMDPGKGDVEEQLPKDGEILTSKGGIEVVAIAPGFIDQNRKAVGDIFTIKDESMLGMWMEPTDKKLAEKHKKAVKQKREEASKARAEAAQRRRDLLGL